MDLQAPPNICPRPATVANSGKADTAASCPASAVLTTSQPGLFERLSP